MAVDTETLIGTIEYKNNMRSIWRSPIVPFIILASIMTGLYVGKSLTNIHLIKH